jgi:hypothetical protein
MLSAPQTSQECAIEIDETGKKKEEGWRRNSQYVIAGTYEHGQGHSRKKPDPRETRGRRQPFGLGAYVFMHLHFSFFGGAVSADKDAFCCYAWLCPIPRMFASSTFSSFQSIQSSEFLG